MGGVDTSTGLVQQTRLIAAPGDYLLTPLSTLSAKLVQQHNLSLEEAHQRVLQSLKLPDFDLGGTPVLHATLAGDVTAAETYPATVAIENAVVVISNYLDAITGIGVELLADTIYEYFAGEISRPDAEIDLSDPVLLESVTGVVGQLFGFADLGASAIAMAEGLAAVNSDISNLPVTADLAFLDAVVKRKIVARGEMASDARLLADVTITETEFVSRYADQVLQARVDAAQSGTIVPVGIAVSDAELVEGDNGITFAEFQVVVSDHFDRAFSVQFATADETADSLDYESVSGSLTWNIGDSNVKTVQVPILGDTESELDESFYLRLFGNSDGIIQRGLGRGIILADDDLVVQLDSTASSSAVSVVVDGETVQVIQDGVEQLNGRLSTSACSRGPNRDHGTSQCGGGPAFQ